MKRPIARMILLSLLFFSACERDPETSLIERPYDPWIFRSVLDDVPRVVTLALHDELWAAYSTQNAGILKAWKGRVLFEGAVYTTAHGPQPRSLGNIYFEGFEGSPWLLKTASGYDSLRVEYRGHRFEGSKGILMYDIVLNDGTSIAVEEYPDAMEKENGDLVFKRSFNTESVPEGVQIALKVKVNSIVSDRDIETNGNWVEESRESNTNEGIDVLSIDGILELNSNGETQFNVSLLNKPAIINPNNNMLKEASMDWHPGAKLIAKSDCKTCHNPTVKTIGPSYKEIAERYPTSPEIKDLLVNKIIKGGGGIWSSQIMSAHPDLAPDDAAQMVEYILSLDPEDEGGTSKQVNIEPEDFLEPAEGINSDELSMGALVKVYQFNSLQTLPPTGGKSPVMGGVLPNFDNISNSDFTDLQDHFSLTGSGYLKIEKDEIIDFRIWSDDGSRVYIGDKLILDHDGLHGTSYKEARVGLKAGYHPFRIEYFNGAGGKFLSFNWKRASQSAFEVIPSEHIFHAFEQQKEVSQLSLPMSVGTAIPGDQMPLTSMHPSFDLAQARPDIFTPKIGGMDFLEDGRMVISRWDPEGGVYILDGVQGEDPENIQIKRIAAGLAEPLGLRVVDNEIYVMQKQELTKLIDTDGDDIIDEYQTLCDDWIVSANFHEFGFGLEYKDGYFYAALAIAINPGGASTQPQVKDRGKAIRVSKEAGELEFVAHGLRTPNGIGLGYSDEIYIADNQGDWLPSSKILHVTKGAWFGSRAVDWTGTEGLTEKPPVVWLPQDEIGNSPSTPLAINVGPYAGQMIHGEVTNGGVKRVFVEEINGEFQGCVFRFIQGLEAGVNRICWGPDGSLYAGGIGNPGNWGHSGKLWYGLQRMKYNGNSTFEMLAVRARTNGLEIEFTEPLEYLDGWDRSLYEVKQWYYKPTIEYGGPKLDERTLQVLSVRVSDDQKKVFLEIEGMKEGQVIYLHLNEHLVSQEGKQLWSTEAWYTMNQIPTDLHGFQNEKPENVGLNVLNSKEEQEGWELIFNGQDMSNFRNFRKETIGNSWIIDDNAIHLNAQKKPEGGYGVTDGGDIITKKTYENFELRLEWKIGTCGNSGIIYHVSESDEYHSVWQTGPEMQVLDNTCHPDSRFRTHRAGDLYDLIECNYESVKPSGQWNKVRIISNNGKMEHWLNGIKVVSFEMGTPEWNEMISKSKFKDMPGFGQQTSGHISLQDHSDPVWYRNIKIKEL